MGPLLPSTAGHKTLSVDFRGTLTTKTGTSMSSPHVAGLISLILSNHPDGASLDVQAVKALLTAGAPMITDHPLAWVSPTCNGSAPAPPVEPPVVPVDPVPTPGPKGPGPTPVMPIPQLPAPSGVPCPVVSPMPAPSAPPARPTPVVPVPSAVPPMPTPAMPMPPSVMYPGGIPPEGSTELPQMPPQ